MLYMNITKLHLLLFVFVIFCICQTNNLIEGLETYQWDNWPDVTTNVVLNTVSENTTCFVDNTDTGLSGVSQCGIVSDSCYNENTKQRKSEGASCTNNGQVGRCLTQANPTQTNPPSEPSFLCVVES